MQRFVQGCQLLLMRLQIGEAEKLGIASVEFRRLDTDPPRNMTKEELEEITPALEKYGWLGWEAA